MGDTNTGTVPTFNSAQIPESSADYHNDFAYEDFMGVHYYNGPHTDWTGVNRPSTNQIEHNGNSRGDVFKYDKELNDTPKVCRPDFHYDDNQKKWVYLPSTTPDQTFGDGRMYKKFTHRFRRLLFNWNPKAATPAHHETYTPIMTIMNGKFADLDLYLDIKEEPKEIILEFDNKEANTYLSLDKTILSGNLSKTVSGTAPSTTDKTNHKLKITCTGEFDQEYTLFARAFKKDASDGTRDKKGEVCGMLRILPNGQMFQHKVQILFITVITNLNGKATNKEGECPPNTLDKFINVLGQALVIPKIITTKEAWNTPRDRYVIT